MVCKLMWVGREWEAAMCGLLCPHAGLAWHVLPLALGLVPSAGDGASALLARPSRVRTIFFFVETLACADSLQVGGNKK